MQRKLESLGLLSEPEMIALKDHCQGFRDALAEDRPHVAEFFNELLTALRMEQLSRKAEVKRAMAKLMDLDPDDDEWTNHLH